MRDPLHLSPEGHDVLVNPIIPPLDVFENEKGLILNIARSASHEIGHVAAIFSRPHVRRADHYHKEDWHFAFVASGRLKYRWRRVLPGQTNDGSVDEIEVEAGQTFFTPPMVEHAMLFLEPTVIITIANRIRTHEDHESDLVRLENPL